MSNQTLNNNSEDYFLQTKSEKDKTEESWIQNFIEEQNQQKKLPEDFKKLSISKLKILLNKLVNLEDYEKAGKIREEISKRENKT